MPNCYYYDEQHNRCKCYVNTELDELLQSYSSLLIENLELRKENAKLRDQLEYDRQTSRSRLERIDQLEAESATLRECCRGLLYMAESSDPEWLHWPEMHDELQKLGVKIVKL